MAKCTDCFKMFFKEVEGDIVCTNCGLVKERGVLDPGPEWRSFAEEWAPDKDKSRVGCPSTELGTAIASSKFDRLVLCNRMVSNISSQAQVARNDIMTMLQDKLNLPNDIVVLAKDILDEYGRRSKLSYKGDRRRLYFVAAAIIYASRALPAGARTRSEICEAAQVTNTSTFSKVCTEIMSALEGTELEKRLMRGSVETLAVINRTIHKLAFLEPKDYGRVRCSVLNIRDRVMGDGRIMPIRSEKLTAAMVYMACKMNNIPNTTHKNVSLTSNTSVATLHKVESILKDILMGH